MRPEPTNTLPGGVRTMWLCEDVVGVLVALTIALGVALPVGAFMPWLPLLVAAGGLARIVIVPRARHRRYRWELREQELDLIEGVLTVTRTVVPITRIQHVSVERTGWTRTFGVVRLSVHTAAGETTIPGLAPARAAQVRDQILARLGTPDDL